MRNRLTLIAVAAALLGSHAGAQGTAPKRKMVAQGTHEDLVARAQQARQEDAAPVFIPLAEGAEDPAKVNRPGDLISRSDIICYNGIATLVPKRSIVHIPKGVADRIAMQDGAKIVTWPDFILANRGWIVTTSVSRAQAEGNEPLPEAVIKSFEKETRLVVAVYQDCPISVLPLKVPEAPTAAAP